MKNLKITLFVFLGVLCFSVNAQKPPRRMPDVAEMHENKWKTMVEQAELTPEEQTAVKPIFLEYEQTVWKTHEERINTMMNFKKNKNSAKIDYDALNDKYINSEIKQALLLRSYHLQLKKLLKPETLFRYYRAERMFKRRLLRNMPPPPDDADGQNK